MYSWTITPVGTFTSLATLTGANTAAPTLTFADLQYPDANQSYTLSLTVTSSDGCSHAYSQIITLYARPSADFTLPTDACGPFSLSPTNLAGSNGTITTYAWTVSDGAAFSLTASTVNPTFSLPQSTSGSVTYTVTQTITDDNGCSDVVSLDFIIFPTPTASFSLGQTGICTGTNINTILTNSSTSNDPSNALLNYTWIIKDTSGTTVHTDTTSLPSYLLTNTTTATITYTIELTVINDDGCSENTSATIDVYPDAIAQLNTTTLDACAPFTIDNNLLSATSFTGNDTYTWTIIDSATNNIITSYSGINALNYTIQNSEDTVWVILKVTSTDGCLDDVDSVLAYTLSNPDPYFDFTLDTGCTAFNPVLDTLNQTNGLHIWEIFDSSNNIIGNTLTGISPIFPTLLNTNSSGLTQYTIEHTVFVTDSSSCDSTYSSVLFVEPLAIPSIDSIATYCALDSINLSGSSTNNSNVAQWKWIVGIDTLIGQNVTYFNNSPGVYPVTLTTTTLFGCDTITYDTLTIHSYPKAQVYINNCGVDTVCLNQPFTAYDSSHVFPFGGNITSYAWDFNDDGTIEYTTASIAHTFSSTGQKALRLSITTEFGCIDDTLISVYVNAPPLNSFVINDSTVCGPSTFTITVSDTGIVDSSFYEIYAFNGSNKAVIQTWNSTPIILPTLQPNYIADTTYFMSRTLYNCCGSTTVIDSIIVRTPPVANFVILPDSGCTPLNVILQLDGLIKGQADSAYIDFGDGSDVSITPTILSQGSGFIYQWGQQNHTFTYGGNFDTTYYVSLSVFNDCGDSTITLPVYVQPNTVQAAYGMNKSSGCAPLTVDFTNYSYNATTAAWCFDWDQAASTCNGGGSVSLNPIWTFTQSGTYVVALFVDNGCGYDTAFQTVTVFPSPTAIITSNNDICANDTVNFISNSTTPSGWIAGHFWEFGNGDTSIIQNPNYIYDTSGTYTVTLTVTSSTGCSDSTSATISIRPTPNVSFTTTDVCLNDTTFFDNLTTISTGQIIGTAWTFGDGNSSNQFEPTHIYSTSGVYNVSLVHTSDYGCIDSSSALAIVHELPQIAFTAELTSGDSCSVPQTYTFTNTSTNSIQYNWDFDYLFNPGVNTSTLTSPSFTYTTPGIYTVALFAETAFGCVDSLFMNILVRDGVKARYSINPIDGCEPLDVIFQDSSIYTTQLDSIVSIQWFFGDGTNSIQTAAPFNLIFTYNSYGTYGVYSVVTMTSGCSDTSAISIINVYPTPTANFSINRVNLNTRRFQNLTNHVDSSITYSWTFSDGQSSKDQSPTVTFQPLTTGLDSIEACLSVVNSYGCSDSICKSFWVWPINLVVPNAFAPGLNYIGEDALFLPKGHSLDQYEIWIYDKWGNEVFNSNKIDPVIKGPSEGWDGKLPSGEPAALGVYAWRIRAVFDEGTRWTGQSNVHGITKTFGTLTLLK